MLLRSLCCLTFCLLITAGCQEAPQAPSAAPSPKASSEPTARSSPQPSTAAAKSIAQSKLYERFDPDGLKEKYSEKFGFVSHASSGSGLIVIATDEIFKAVEIRGGISDEDFQQVLDGVQKELFELAKSTVTVAGEPSPDVKARPEWLFKMYFKDVKPEDVRGSYFTYTQGPIQGAVEILAMATEEEKKKPGWKLNVVLHETSTIVAGK